MTQAYIFDFDGVLASSETPRFNALKYFAARHNIPIHDSIKDASRGKTTKKVLYDLLPDNIALAEQILEEFQTEYRENITQFVTPIEFTVNWIRKYRGTIPLAIASMSSKLTIERLTKHFGVHNKISYIASKDDVTRHKPDPEIYLKTAHDLQIRPEDCLVFEDTRLGYQAAQAAAMPCCIILNGENSKNEFLDLDVYAFIEKEEDLNKLIQI